MLQVGNAGGPSPREALLFGWARPAPAPRLRALCEGFAGRFRQPGAEAVPHCPRWRSLHWQGVGRSSNHVSNCAILRFGGCGAALPHNYAPKQCRLSFLQFGQCYPYKDERVNFFGKVAACLQSFRRCHRMFLMNLSGSRCVLLGCNRSYHYSSYYCYAFLKGDVLMSI